MQPLSNDTADVDEEDDPEYNVLEDEELDKEELRRDIAVTVSRTELKTLMMELLQGPLEDFSSDDETTKPPRVVPPVPASPKVRIQNLKICGKIVSIEFLKFPSLVNFFLSIDFFKVPETVQNEDILVSPPASPEEPVIGLSLPQRNLLLQQIRQHVQLLTQHFLQTYQHPLFNNISKKCKVMLVELESLAKMNPESSVNVFNLHKAMGLTEHWTDLLSSSNGSDIIR